MTVRPRGDGFQADFTHKGARYRAQFPSQQEGLQWEADMLAALIAGRPLPTAPTGATNGVMTWGALAKQTIERYWTDTKSAEWAQRNAHEAVDFFGANTQVASTRGAKIDEYVSHLQKKRLSGSTINRKLAAVSKMFSYAKRLEAITDKPVIERQKEGDARERFLTPEEAQAIIDTFRHWGLEEDASFTEFLLDTGARLSEGLSVRVRDLGSGWPAKVIDRATLGAGETGSKNGLSRVVPLTERLRERLPPMILGRNDPTGKVFAGVNRATYTGRFKRVRDHLGLGDDVVIHTLRHTCASWLVQRGVDLRRVKEWMGHKSIQTTMRYAKLAPVSLFEAVHVLDQPGEQRKEAA